MGTDRVNAPECEQMGKKTWSTTTIAHTSRDNSGHIGTVLNMDWSLIGLHRGGRDISRGGGVWAVQYTMGWSSEHRVAVGQKSVWTQVVLEQTGWWAVTNNVMVENGALNMHHGQDLRWRTANSGVGGNGWCGREGKLHYQISMCLQRLVG
jgi:hypothetical protein